MSCARLRIETDRLRDFTRKVFLRLGLPEQHAALAANVLIEADLRGFESHGVARLYPCYQRVRKGLVQVDPQIRVEWLTPTTGWCDGGNGLGMVVGFYAMEACLSRAEELGAAFLAVRRSNHFGIAGYYSSMALEREMIGIAMTNASPRVVPTRGTTGVLGTNPISVAIPRKGKHPFLLDMSTSAISSGKLDVAVRKGTKIPEGWVYPSVEPFLDEDGVVPMSVLQYPLGGKEETGGYKGFGLALMVDLLCGVLSGANFGTRLAASKREEEANVGHFFGALKLSGFRQFEEFSRDLELLFRDIKSSPRESEVEEILIAGEPEWRAKEKNLAEGIPVLPPVWRKLEEIAEALNLPLPG